MTDPKWRERKLRELCDERHPILSRQRSGHALPTDRALLQHIHREIDFYQMQEFEPAHARHVLQMRKMNGLMRRVKNLTARLDGERARQAKSDKREGSG